MKTRETEPIAFPDDAELAALRAWYAGLDTRAAVARYLVIRPGPLASLNERQRCSAMVSPPRAAHLRGVWIARSSERAFS
jgi:hypothetical protein